MYEKPSRLSQTVIERRLRYTVNQLVRKENIISVRKVAKAAGVSASTAYKYNCKAMILDALDRLEEES